MLLPTIIELSDEDEERLMALAEPHETLSDVVKRLVKERHEQIGLAVSYEEWAAANLEATAAVKHAKETDEQLATVKRLLSSAWWGYHDVMDVFHDADLPFKSNDEPTMFMDPDEANELHELMKGWENENG